MQESRPSCLVNQFPFENVVTVKDLLAIVSRRVKESQSWLPITYNLSYEMPKFIEYYRQRDKNDLDNIWIMKPWNLARSIDTTVTDNLNQIIRSQETGPKVKTCSTQIIKRYLSYLKDRLQIYHQSCAVSSPRVEWKRQIRY